MRKSLLVLLSLVFLTSLFSENVRKPYNSILDERGNPQKGWWIEYNTDSVPYSNSTDLEQDILKVLYVSNCVSRGSCWPVDDESYFSDLQVSLAKAYGMCKVWRRNVYDDLIEEYYCFSTVYGELVSVMVIRSISDIKPMRPF